MMVSPRLLKIADAAESQAPQPVRFGPRRGLRRPDAAAYIGVSEGKFDEMVAKGKMPRPIRVDKCVIWDIRALDRAFDALQGIAQPVQNPWD